MSTYRTYTMYSNCCFFLILAQLALQNHSKSGTCELNLNRADCLNTIWIGYAASLNVPIPIQIVDIQPAFCQAIPKCFYSNVFWRKKIT